MRVCIAEKPSVAKEIAEILGAKVRRNGYFEGNDYCVTVSYTHLIQESCKDPSFDRQLVRVEEVWLWASVFDLYGGVPHKIAGSVFPR